MQEKFPHVLTRPDQSNGFSLRFVTSDEVNPEDVIKEPTNYGNGHLLFRVNKIKEKRLAKGDWTNWPTHPHYYEATGRQL